MLVNEIIFILSLAGLYIFTNLTIKTSERLSHALRISPFGIGLIFISVSTSLPELFISALSALGGTPELGLGNIFGANVADLTLVLALAILINNKNIVIRKDHSSLIKILFLSSLIPILIFQMGTLNIIHAAILLIIFLFFAKETYKKETTLEKLEEEIEKTEEMIRKKRYSMVTSLIFFFGSVLALLASSNFLVRYAVELATDIGLSTAIIGATIVAVGTTLPELSVSLMALRKKKSDLVLGTLVGSCITNITLVLGVIPIFSPAPIVLVPFANMLPFLLFSSLSVWYLIDEERFINKTSALVLIGLYVFFILSQTGFLRSVG